MRESAAVADGSGICAFIPLYEGEVTDIFLTDLALWGKNTAQE